MLQISKKQKIWFMLGAVSFVLFVAFTVVVAFVDVEQVGLSHLNQFFWQHCGQHVACEHITDGIGYCLILAISALVVWQICQWVQRKSLRQIDRNLLWLDVICVGLFAVYLFFEIVVVNHRPLLENGVAKASYPSSHVMLFATILPSLIWQVWHYLKSKPWCIVLTVFLTILLVVGVVGRMFSGVHWFTDIVAGLIMSCCLNCFYLGFTGKRTTNQNL